MLAERDAILSDVAGTSDDAARDTILALLAKRAPEATICPSEVARALTVDAHSGRPDEGWRDRMPVVHAAIDLLVSEGAVCLSWKGKALAQRAGPYRIGRSARD